MLVMRMVFHTERVQIEFGDGARDGNWSWGIERWQLWHLVGLDIVMIRVPRGGMGGMRVECRHCRKEARIIAKASVC